MKVLIVCSVNSGKINPFITEQVAALQKLDIEMDFFTVTSKGIGGYLKHLPGLIRMIKTKSYDLVHAHYGLSGLLAVLQQRSPVVTTFHGSDVNQKKVIPFSRFAARLSAHNIVVEKSFAGKLGAHKKTSVIPCGVDLDTFFPIEKQTARSQLGISAEERIVLFTSNFANPVKNYPLAKDAVDRIPGVHLQELKGFTREHVNLWMNAADVLLLTSFTEGSPQVVKEALACNLPVVSVPAGDVPQLAAQVSSIYITPYDPEAIARQISIVLAENSKPDSRHMVQHYDNARIAMRIRNIYNTLVSKNKH